MGTSTKNSSLNTNHHGNINHHGEVLYDDGVVVHWGWGSAATDADADGEEEEENDDGGDDPVPVGVLLAEVVLVAVVSDLTVGGTGALVYALLEMDDGALGEVRVSCGDGRGDQDVVPERKIAADGDKGVGHSGRA
jgi:hypothetical protein